VLLIAASLIALAEETSSTSTAVAALHDPPNGPARKLIDAQYRTAIIFQLLSQRVITKVQVSSVSHVIHSLRYCVCYSSSTLLVCLLVVVVVCWLCNKNCNVQQVFLTRSRASFIHSFSRYNSNTNNNNNNNKEELKIASRFIIHTFFIIKIIYLRTRNKNTIETSLSRRLRNIK